MCCRIELLPFEFLPFVRMGKARSTLYRASSFVDPPKPVRVSQRGVKVLGVSILLEVGVHFGCVSGHWIGTAWVGMQHQSTLSSCSHVLSQMCADL